MTDHPNDPVIELKLILQEFGEVVRVIDEAMGTLQAATTRANALVVEGQRLSRTVGNPDVQPRTDAT